MAMKHDTNFPWHLVAENIQYIAMDLKGSWYGYQEEPWLEESIWDIEDSSVCIDFIKFNKNHPDWENSLEKRPEGEYVCIS
jgi:hypothetical protein